MGMKALSLKAILGLDSSEYNKGLKEAEGKASSFGSAIGNGFKTIAKVGAAAIGTATTAVTAFAASSVKTGMSFDKSMAQVAATMGKTMDEMQNEVGSVTLNLNGQTKEFTGTLREFAQEMGRNTSFSATQAADALNYMALAGYDTQTSMNILPDVLNLAAAGSMDLARASDMVTDTQTAFGITLERTSQMVDEMAKAASTGNTSVEQLGDAFLVVGGLAKELNGGMVTLKDGTTQSVDGVQELEIALTAMANAGVKGSEAGTHMRNMLLKLSSPTDDGVAQMKALGVSVFDAGGQMRSLKDIMGDLNGALGNLTQEEKIQAISDLFNTRDMAAAEALLGAVGQDWDEIGESILNAEGAAQKMADTQLDSLSGDIVKFKSALEGAQIAVSDKLSPSLRDFVKLGTSGLQKITDAFTSGGLTGAVNAFGEALSSGVTLVLDKVPAFVDAGIQLVEALGKGLISNLPKIVSALPLSELLNGIVKAIKGLADELAKTAPSLIPIVIQAILDTVKTLLDNAPELEEAGWNLLQGLADGILNAIPVIINMIPQLLNSFITQMVARIPIVIDGAIRLVNGIVRALPQIVQALVDAMPLVIDGVVNGLIQALPALIQGCIQLTLALVAALPQIISALIDAVPMIIQAITQAITANAQMIFMAVVQILAQVGSELLAKGAEFVKNVGQTMMNILNTTVQWLSQLPEKMAYWAGYAIGSFIKFVMELPGKISSIFTTVISKVVSFGTNFANKAREMATTFVNNMINNIKNLPANVWNVFTTIISNVISFANDFTNKAREAAVSFANNLINGITSLPSRVASLASQLVSAVSSLPSKFAEIGSRIVDGLWSGIKGGWDWLKDKVSNLADSLFQGAKDALGIHSPSRKFAWIGQMVDEGLAGGIDKFAYLVDDAIDGITSSMANTAPQVLLAGDVGGNFGGQGGYNQTVNIYSPTALSPSEVARQTRNATRDMVLELRGKR